MAAPSSDHPLGKPVAWPPGRSARSRRLVRRGRFSSPYPAVVREPVNWRAVGMVVALLVMTDCGLFYIVLGLAQDYPDLLSFSAPPAVVRPAADQSGLAKRNSKPPRLVIKRLDPSSADELNRQLLAAPELDLASGAGTSARLVADARRADLRLAHPVSEPLLRRPDLHGLPITMGAHCQLDRDSARDLQILSGELRRYLSRCAGSDNCLDARALRQQLLQKNMLGRRREEEAVPTLVQMLQAEDRPVRLVLVELLARSPSRAATTALVGRAVFDLSADVREAAVAALNDRPRDEYRQLLLEGLRYPWAPAADHAAEALVALNDRDAILPLADLLGGPDPAGPVPLACHAVDLAQLGPRPGAQQPRPLTAVALDDWQWGERRTRLMAEPDGLPQSVKASPGEVYAVREVVRVNHLRNCLLCHAPATSRIGPVPGLVPSPDQPLPPPFSLAYYNGSSGTFVRADVTYLRQDFSVPQPVAAPGKWPAHQRYDYLVRTRYPTQEELAKKAPATYPQHEAVRWALRELSAAAGR